MAKFDPADKNLFVLCLVLLLAALCDERIGCSSRCSRHLQRSEIGTSLGRSPTNSNLC